MPRPMKSKAGSAGEAVALLWCKTHAWVMFRSQPEVNIIAHLTKDALYAVARILHLPRLAFFGHLMVVRMHKGGIADYTGYALGMCSGYPTCEYRAMEVKESGGDTMPASRLDVEQRAWMQGLPAGCAFVGILWTDGAAIFEVHRFVEAGSYKKGSGER